MRWMFPALAVLGAIVAVGAVAPRPAQPAKPANEAARGAYSGLPVPRFVSLKADRVNVRAGPSREHEVTWVFTRSALPVEIVAEFETWRRIRDVDGQEGWVYHSLLSGRRTALVAPWSHDEQTLSLRVRAERDAPVAARLEPGVLATVKRCTANWCRLTGDGFDGYIEQERLWGVYPNEQLD